jgi:hypothetical protein
MSETVSVSYSKTSSKMQSYLTWEEKLKTLARNEQFGSTYGFFLNPKYFLAYGRN